MEDLNDSLMSFRAITQRVIAKIVDKKVSDDMKVLRSRYNQVID